MADRRRSREMDDGELRTRRWRAQQLAPRCASRDPAAVVRALGAVQAQDPFAAALALRVRSDGGFDATAVERARTDERSVVRTWCHRATMHLVPTEDVGWLQRLLAPTLHAGRERNFAKLGLDAATDEAVRRLLGKELKDGPLTRSEIGERCQAAGIDVAGYRLPHLVTRIAIDGLLCDGPDRGRERTFVLRDDWVKVPKGPSGKKALAELARRHLAGHGPAEPRDLAAWSGLSVGDARAAWEQLGDEIEEVATARGPQWVLGGRSRGGSGSWAAKPTVRLLAGFDAYLLGYQDRELAVPPPHTKRVQAGGLRVLPSVAVDGVVVGTWRADRKARRVDVRVDPFGAFDPSLLADEVADVGRFLGLAAELV